MVGRALRVRRASDPFEEVHQLFNELVRGWAGGDLTPFRTFDQGSRAFSPTVDVTEDEQAIRVSVELPGVDEKDVEVSLSGDVLTISGEKRDEKEDQGEGYYRLERSYGAFHRAIPLPAEIASDKVEASFKKGVLTVTLPKTDEAQHTKKITVKGE